MSGRVYLYTTVLNAAGVPDSEPQWLCCGKPCDPSNVSHHYSWHFVI